MIDVVGKTIAEFVDHNEGGCEITFTDGTRLYCSGYECENALLSIQDIADDERRHAIIKRLWLEHNAVPWEYASGRDKYGEPVGFGGFYRLKGTAATSTPQSDIDWIRESK